MFPPRTVFIVGAGASNELGLPLGSGLRSKIRDILHFSENIGFQNEEVARAVVDISGGRQSLISDYYHAALRIQDGLEHVASIDTFLNIHHENEAVVKLGKIAICIAIRDAEHRSALSAMFLTHDLGQQTTETLQKKYEDSWYVPFGDLLTQGARLDEIDTIFDEISVITFNYDRCLELFAEHLLRRAYGIGDRARDIASRLEVLHVYGQVGRLFSDGARSGTSFGRTQHVDYVELSKGIKTFTETVDSDMGARIRDRIRAAETLVFLGFGWLPQNLELLTAQGGNVRRIFFTTTGIQEADRETVIMDLQHAVDRPAGFDLGVPDHGFRAFEERGGCAQLFRGHWRQLTRR